MIKVNLLGKKKKPLPFGLDKALDKAGISEAQLAELRPSLPKLAVLVIGIYLANFVPNYLYEQRMQELQEQQAVVAKTVSDLRAEIGSLRKVRQEMERLQKEEGEIEAQLSTIDGLSKGREIAFNVLNSVAEILPAKVWVDRIDYRTNSLDVKGSSWEFFPINDFVRSLTENTKFDAVTLRSIRAQAPSGALEPGIPASEQKTKDFQIEMLVRGTN